METVAKALGNGNYEWVEPERPAPFENGWAHDQSNNWE